MTFADFYFLFCLSLEVFICNFQSIKPNRKCAFGVQPQEPNEEHETKQRHSKYSELCTTVK